MRSKPSRNMKSVVHVPLQLGDAKIPSNHDPGYGDNLIYLRWQVTMSHIACNQSTQLAFTVPVENLWSLILNNRGIRHRRTSLGKQVMEIGDDTSFWSYAGCISMYARIHFSHTSDFPPCREQSSQNPTLVASDSGGILRLVVRKIHLTWKTIQNAYRLWEVVLACISRWAQHKLNRTYWYLQINGYSVYSLYGVECFQHLFYTPYIYIPPPHMRVILSEHHIIIEWLHWMIG